MQGKHVHVDLRDVKRARDELAYFARRALPHAARNALNASAFEGRKLWQAELQRSFTLRNKYVTKGIRVIKAHGTDPRSMHAVLGATTPLMDELERGATVHGRAGSKPIPTPTAAGQAPGTRPRTRVVRRANYLRAIRLARTKTGGKGRKQQNAIAIARSRATGRRFVHLELQGGRRGIFKVTGRKRISVRMVWDLSKKSVRIPRVPTLQRTLDQLEPRLPSIHIEALFQQMLRHGHYWRVRALL